MTNRRFGWYVPNENGTMDLGRHTTVLSEEIWEEFNRIVAITSELRPFVVDFVSLENNFALLTSTEDDLARHVESMNNPIEINGVDHIQNLARAQGAISNFLSAASALRERGLTRLRSRYGKDSLETKKFKAAMTDAYDGWFAYRLLYNLRNYEQHHDMPLSIIPISAARDNTGQMRAEARLVLKPKDLLESNLIQAAFRTKELVHRVDDILLMPLAKQFMQLHGSMFKAIVEMHVERLMEFQAYARAVFKTMKLPKNAKPIIWEGEDISNPRVYQFSFEEVGFLNILFNRLESAVRD